MKVMLVNSVYGVGSTGKIVKDLYDQINSAGDQAIVCYGRGDKYEDRKIKKISSGLSVYIDAGLSRISGMNGIYSNASTNRLIDEVERFIPDVIHLHNLHGYYLNYYRFIEYLKTKDIPVIWTLHDELMYTGHCAYAFTCDKWEKECFQCPQVKKYPKSLLFDTSKVLYNKKKELFHNFSRCIYVTPSAWLGQRVSGSILHAEKVRVIHNGIDVDEIFIPRFRKELYEKVNPEHKRIILTVTDDINSERKGMSDFLKLASMCPEYQFLVVGGVIENCSVKNIGFIGLTQNQKELAEYYSIADAFVITSTCDNFPTVCIESLSCGTPVIGFDTGGTSETAPIETIGKFSPYGDLNTLIKNIRSFLSADRGQARRRCRDYAKAHYSRKLMTQSYLDLYRDITD